MKRIITISLVAAFIFTLALSPVLAQNLSNTNKQLINKYNSAKAQYLKYVNFYTNAKSGFLNAKGKYQKAKNSANTQSLLERTESFLENTTAAMTSYLESIKIKVQASSGLNESQRAAVIAEIDQDISWLTNHQAQIENLSNHQQVIDHAKQIRNYWGNVRVTAKRAAGQVLAADINVVINKANEYSQTAQDKIDELKENGYDTQNLESLLQDYNQNVDLAEKKYESAKQQFAAISNLGNADSLFRSGHNFLKEANQYLRQAHSDLVRIVNEINQATKSETE